MRFPGYAQAAVQGWRVALVKNQSQWRFLHFLQQKFRSFDGLSVAKAGTDLLLVHTAVFGSPSQQNCVCSPHDQGRKQFLCELAFNVIFPGRRELQIALGCHAQCMAAVVGVPRSSAAAFGRSTKRSCCQENFCWFGRGEAKPSSPSLQRQRGSASSASPFAGPSAAAAAGGGVKLCPRFCCGQTQHREDTNNQLWAFPRRRQVLPHCNHTVLELFYLGTPN